MASALADASIMVKRKARDPRSKSAAAPKPVAGKTLADVIAELRRRGPLSPEDRFPDIDSDLPPAEPVDL
jgi:hypothetical protein